jgi:hypothetical protein
MRSIYISAFLHKCRYTNEILELSSSYSEGLKMYKYSKSWDQFFHHHSIFSDNKLDLCFLAKVCEGRGQKSYGISVDKTVVAFKYYKHLPSFVATSLSTFSD